MTIVDALDGLTFCNVVIYANTPDMCQICNIMYETHDNLVHKVSPLFSIVSKRVFYKIMYNDGAVGARKNDIFFKMVTLHGCFIPYLLAIFETDNFFQVV